MRWSTFTAVCIVYPSLAGSVVAANVEVLSGTATITASSSYFCGESDSDSVVEQQSFTQLAGIDEIVESSITGSCASATSWAHIEAIVAENHISLNGGAEAYASEVGYLTGSRGTGSYAFQVVLRVDAPANVKVYVSGSGGGQGSGGGECSTQLRDAEGTILFDGTAYFSFGEMEEFEELLLPAGDYTLRGEGSYSARDFGGGGSGSHYIRFLDAIAAERESFGALKARY